MTGNLEKAQQTCELWAQTYPRDVDAHGLLSGFSSQGTGQYEKAIEEAKKAIGLDPDFALGVRAIWLSAMPSSTAWTKPRTRFSEPPSANWKSLSFWSCDMTSPF